VLTSIGYESNEDTDHELTITGHTAAKVFFRMLWQLQKWGELPWNDDQGADEGLDEAFLLSPRLIAQGDADLSDPLNRQKAEIGSLGSDPVRSLAQRPDWVPLDLAARPDEYVQELRQIDLTLPALIAELQDLMTQNGFQWFHPSDARLIVRAPQTRTRRKRATRRRREGERKEEGEGKAKGKETRSRRNWATGTRRRQVDNGRGPHAGVRGCAIR
jgi:hypothetical protein